MDIKIPTFISTYVKVINHQKKEAGELQFTYGTVF